MSEWRTFAETYARDPSLVTWAYLRLMFTLMTTINAAPFLYESADFSQLGI